MAESHLIVSGCFLLAMLASVSSLPMCNSVDEHEEILICSGNQSNIVLKRGFIAVNNSAVAITLRGCKISELERNALANLSSVKYLDLSENNLAQLKSDDFEGIPAILYLNLSNNLIPQVQGDIFISTPDLLVLDLSQNEIDYLGIGIFDSLKKLEHVDLSWNMLSGRDLNSSYFKNNKRMAYISFMGSDMNDTPEDLLCAFEVLETLNLNECALDTVPSFATKSNLKSLKELIISSNQISELRDEKLFCNTENLDILDIADNELKYIAENIFMPLKKLRIVILRYNNLTHLPDRLFRNLEHLELIDLSNNMLTEISANLFYGTSLKKLDLGNNMLTHLPENFCLQLKTGKTNLTEFYFNKNPWQCVCLKELLNEIEELRIEHDFDSPSTPNKNPICETSDSRCKREARFNSVFTEIYHKIKSQEQGVVEVESGTIPENEH